jgi:hypothetical protein
MNKQAVRFLISQSISLNHLWLKVRSHSVWVGNVDFIQFYMKKAGLIPESKGSVGCGQRSQMICPGE